MIQQEFVPFFNTQRVWGERERESAVFGDGLLTDNTHTHTQTHTWTQATRLFGLWCVVLFQYHYLLLLLLLCMGSADGDDAYKRRPASKRKKQTAFSRPASGPSNAVTDCAMMIRARATHSFTHSLQRIA